MIADKIALRYLTSKKSHSAVNIISYVSIAGVALATAAMIIVLSVFNGFSDFALAKTSLIDPDMRVSPLSGKVINNADSICEAIGSIEGVKIAAPVIAEKGFAIAGDRQTPVELRGIAPDGPTANALTRIIIDGEAMLDTIGPYTTAISSVGIANNLLVSPRAPRPVSIYEPRRVGRINPANPANAFRRDSLLIAGVFQVEQQEYDTDILFVPIATARRLLSYASEASEIEISVEPGADPAAVKSAVKAALSPALAVSDRLEQQAQSLRMIAIEKWVTLAMLIFIMVIASFNILSTMSILIVEKRPNHAILRAMGAPKQLIGSIYSRLSFIITAIGGCAGLALGVGLSLAQQYGKFIKFNAEDMTAMAIDAYPVRVIPADILIVAAIIAATGTACALIMRRD